MPHLRSFGVVFLFVARPPINVGESFVAINQESYVLALLRFGVPIPCEMFFWSFFFGDSLELVLEQGQNRFILEHNPLFKKVPNYPLFRKTIQFKAKFEYRASRSLSLTL